MVIATMGIFVPAAEAKTTAAVTVDPQVRVRIGGQRNRRPYYGNRRPYYGNRRTRTFTRIRRVGRYRYRETVRVTYLPNGRTRTQVIRRVRLGRAW